MTETESWILNEFANDVALATRTGDQELIDSCQQEYDDYLKLLKERAAS